MPPAVTTVYLGLGSNLGPRQDNLRRAVQMLAGGGVSVRRVSSLYLTEPVGVPGGDFVNAVAEADTKLEPVALLERCHAVEDALGRTTRGDLLPRPIDIDILLYGSLQLQLPGLIVPHPRLHLRRFVLAPLAEIAPGVLVAGAGKTTQELLRSCSDTSRVELVHG